MQIARAMKFWPAQASAGLRERTSLASVRRDDDVDADRAGRFDGRARCADEGTAADVAADATAACAATGAESGGTAADTVVA